MFNAEELSFFSIDMFLRSYPWLATVEVNNYPLIVIVWNFLLALIPLVLAALLYRIYLKTKFKNLFSIIWGLLVFLIWLLFVPNTAYIITEVRHLLDYCSPPLIQDVCLNNAWMIMIFFVYACLGWIFFVLALRQMETVMKRIFNNKISSLFVILIIPLIALGVLLGLLQRFNSWDIVSSPLIIFKNMLLYLNNKEYLLNFIVFSSGLYILYFLGVLLFGDRCSAWNNYDDAEEKKKD